MAEKNFILFDDDCRDHLLPFTFTRPVAELRVGILTIKEKWQRSLNIHLTYFTQAYLQKKYPFTNNGLCCFINGSVLPDPRLVAQVLSLQPGELIEENNFEQTGKSLLIAFCDFYSNERIDNLQINDLVKDFIRIAPANSPKTIRRKEDIFVKNSEALRDDYKLITYKRRSATIYESNKVVNRNNIFIEEGAKVEFAYLNASTGPIYIGKNAEVMEGAMMRGPVSIGDKSIVKMGTKIYGATTIGPVCTVGGEIINSVILGYSNKGHDGFLGNAVIGEWCNLGADSNNSNLKNDYGEVKLWDYATRRFEPTGMQFCGLMMGDHSKCGINTMFNTGTVVGVFVNVFGAAFPRNFIPSFQWGGASGFTEYKYEKAMEVASLVMQRRNVELTDADKEILLHVHDLEMKK
ncbi:MAG: GlmU family protein [Chitinophagales bacterium]|nr:GlmU family protein [Chitinophagales bacterium]